ncbi:MAG TPA: hypothetical protein PLI09_01055 [Candidatus Hydrogenedentes bacterium]|nr:hypothetical protein [Candidatus Hydrogenedentota bacterium]
MLYAPNMLLIGAADRNAGKTVFACEVIRRFREVPVLGAKVTAVQERDGKCPRGGQGCGVCSSLEGDFCLTEETETSGAKDTQRLLASGAQRVFWLRVLKQHLETGTQALLDALGPDTPVICESNSLRHAVKPGLFLMIQHRESNTFKVSAQGVRQYADETLSTDGQHFDFDFNRIKLANKRWVLDPPANPANNSFCETDKKANVK